MEDFLKNFKNSVEDTIKWLQDKYSSMRSGRAQISMIDSVLVSQYGNKVPLKNIASISIEDARTMLVAPWDKENVKSIESAILSEDIGVGVSSQDTSIRVSFPDLTSETRQLLIKKAKDLSEEAKISLRVARDKEWNTIQKMEKDKTLSENEKFTFKKQLQKEIEEGNKRLSDLSVAKQKELDN